MAVAEVKLDRVTPDRGESGDRHSGEIPAFLASANALSQQIVFSLRFGAGRQGSQLIHGKIIFDSIFPTEGDFVADELNVCGLDHEAGILAAEVANSTAGSFRPEFALIHRRSRLQLPA